MRAIWYNMQFVRLPTYWYDISIDSEGFKTDYEKLGHWDIGTCRCG